MFLPHAKVIAESIPQRPLDKERRRQLKALTERLGVPARQLHFYDQATTMPGTGRELHVPNYERMEFLGDAILRLALNEFLFLKYPCGSVSTMTGIASDLLSNRYLAELGEQLGLSEFIPGGCTSIWRSADMFEAIIAAVYLSSGMTAVRRVVQRLFSEPSEAAYHPSERHANPTIALKAYLQERGTRPQYVQLPMQYDKGERVYRFQIQVNGKPVAKGAGLTTNRAQMAAASAALQQLRRAS